MGVHLEKLSNHENQNIKYMGDISPLFNNFQLEIEKDHFIQIKWSKTKMLLSWRPVPPFSFFQSAVGVYSCV